MRKGYDIRIEQDFYKDYDRAPPHAKKAIDKLVRLIVGHTTLPNSLQAHKASMVTIDITIGYVTRTKEHWRLLFREEGRDIVFCRLMTHADVAHYLKTWI